MHDFVNYSQILDHFTEIFNSTIPTELNIDNFENLMSSFGFSCLGKAKSIPQFLGDLLGHCEYV